MRRIIKKLIIINCCFFLFMYPTALAVEEPTLEETKLLLQKGLSIYEIDQELARLTKKEKQLGIEISKTEQESIIQSKTVEITKERAGQVLKSYYMGERESLIMLLFSVESLSEAIHMLHFINIILQSDQRALDYYLDSYQELLDLHAKLLVNQTELTLIKDQFLKQRQTLVELQEELDHELEKQLHADLIVQLIEELTLDWQDNGLPIFKNYFSALSHAMQQLPEIQTYHKNILSLKGSTIQFQVTDDQLNEFLILKNDIFENMTFHFMEGHIEAQGQQEEMTATIKGRYELFQEPKNNIRFQIDELIYNGFVLPESTSRALEEEFDLSFHPDQFSFLGFQVEATEVHMEFGKLRILLKFK